jgi:uncharacterized protein involved in exopolysaccharide biosynthesis
MITNRELRLDDYVAVGRRRWALLLVPALLGPLVGLLVSFALTPKYTSRSILAVEGQVVPAGYVRPLIADYVSDRMTTLQQNVLGRDRLREVVERLGLARKGKSVDSVINEIRDNVSVNPVDPNAPSAPGDYNSTKRKKTGQSDDVPGFSVSFTTDNARDAQQVCSEITSMLLAENLKVREQVVHSTTDFLSRQLDQAQQNLDNQDKKLAAFKREHLGQLPVDVENNLRILMEVSAQLDGTTQTLNRAQQDKSFEEALLAQQAAAWRFSQATPNVPSLHDQLVALQNQLVTLRVRYTENHPDVAKAKKDIAELKAKLKAMNGDADESANPEIGAGKVEPPEILQLRQEIHQSEDLIERTTLEQKRLQKQIDSYQGRLALSPEVEEKYKQLTRDSETALKLYSDLLANKSQAEMQTEMERRAEGEQMRLFNPAILPGAPSYPVRWMFALDGLGAGLGIGFGLVLWLELEDKSIRNEGDVHAGLELPMLAAMPWAGETPGAKRRFNFLMGKEKTA